MASEDSTEDFVVVNEKDNAEREALTRLQTAADVLGKALDAVNESSFLLREQLQSALSVTLQYIPNETTISTEEIVKSLDQNVASTEEIRAKYVRNLCSKLVSASAETAKLRAEVEALKLSADQNDKEMKESLMDLSSAVQSLQTVTEQLELSSRSGNNPARPNTPETFQDAVAEPASIRSLCADITSVRDRLAQLKVNSQPQPVPPTVTCDATTSGRETPRTYVDNCSMTESNKCLQGVQANAAVLDLMIQTDEVPTVPAPPYDFQPERTQDSQPSSSAQNSSTNDLRVATSPMANPTAAATAATTADSSGPRGDQAPSFNAQDEEPWCPCCSQRFASRPDLEEHLPFCLQY